MTNRTKRANPSARRVKDVMDAQRTDSVGGQRILTHSIGALPIINRQLKRMRLETFFAQHIGKEDKRVKIDTPRIAMLTVRNVLMSREPLYMMTEWARDHGPECYDVAPKTLRRLTTA